MVAVQSGVVPVPGVPVGRPLGVGALDGRVDGVAVLRGGVARGVGRVGRGGVDEGLGVTGHVLAEDLGGRRPGGVVVRGALEEGDQLGRSDDAAQRLLRGGGAQLQPLVLDLGAGVAEVVGGVVRGHPVLPVLPAALEGDVLVQVGLVPDLVAGGVDDAVDDHAADVVREEGAVDGAEVGAVGDAEVVELRLAERGADDVEVARGVRRGHVREHLAAALEAALGVRAGEPPLDALVRLGAGHGVGLGRRDELLGVHAGDGSGVADAAGVEADEVVGLGRLRPHRALARDAGGEAQAGAAGTAGVVDERALALALASRVADAVDGELDLLAVRLGVVQRHRDVAALDGLRQVPVGGAVLPVDTGPGGAGGGDGRAARLPVPAPRVPLAVGRGGARGGRRDGAGYQRGGDQRSGRAERGRPPPHAALAQVALPVRVRDKYGDLRGCGFPENRASTTSLPIR